MICFYERNKKYYIERVFLGCPLRLTPSGVWQLAAYFYDSKESAEYVVNQHYNNKPTVRVIWDGTKWSAKGFYKDTVILHFNEDIISDEDNLYYFPWYYPIGKLLKLCRENNIIVELSTGESGDI